MLFFKIIFFIFLICITWFGLGAWLRNQPSTLLYIGGTVLNILVPAIVAKGLQLALKDFNKGV